jgi:hypothetical protein
MIKAEVQEVPKSPAPGFPKLMQGDFGNILLMTSATEGTVLAGCGDMRGWDIGHHANNWNPPRLRDFPDALTLSNAKE